MSMFDKGLKSHPREANVQSVRARMDNALPRVLYVLIFCFDYLTDK